MKKKVFREMYNVTADKLVDDMVKKTGAKTVTIKAVKEKKEKKEEK